MLYPIVHHLLTLNCEINAVQAPLPRFRNYRIACYVLHICRRFRAKLPNPEIIGFSDVNFAPNSYVFTMLTLVVGNLKLKDDVVFNGDVFNEHPSTGKQLLGKGNNIISLPFLAKETEVAKK